MNTIEFNLNHAGNIETLYISNGIYMTPKFCDDDVRRAIKKLIEDNKIELGEETEGCIRFTDEKNSMFNIEYRFCDDFNQDWDGDYWTDEEVNGLHTEDYF